MAVDWQLGGKGNELLLPYPLTVARALAELAVTAGFWQAVGLTLCRILAGLAAGTALGAGLALLTCASRWADLLLSPAIRVVRATPVASFIVLVLLWVHTDRVPSVISALMVLPVVWANVAKGVRETDPQLLELARAYGFGRGKTLRLIYLPSVQPYFTAGLTTAVGLAWKSGVAAEVLCLPKRAIGTQVLHAKLYLEIPSLFAWTVTVVVLSFLLESALTRLLRRLGRGARP
jgi:NitT/TauT family transport system permease protein